MYAVWRESDNDNVCHGITSEFGKNENLSSSLSVPLAEQPQQSTQGGAVVYPPPYSMMKPPEYIESANPSAQQAVYPPAYQSAYPTATQTSYPPVPQTGYPPAASHPTPHA